MTSWLVISRAFLFFFVPPHPKSEKNPRKSTYKKILALFIMSQQFSVMPGQYPVFLAMSSTSTKQRIMCIAQGHSTVTPGSLEPVTHRLNLTRYTTALNNLYFSQNFRNCPQGFFSAFWEHDPTPRIGNFRVVLYKIGKKHTL